MIYLLGVVVMAVVFGVGIIELLIRGEAIDPILRNINDD